MRRWWPPLLLLAAVVGVWELVVRAAHVPDYLFPAPSAVARSLFDDRGLLASATLVTVREIVLGYRARASRSRWRSRSRCTSRRRCGGRCCRSSSLSQTVPTVVLAPVLAILLGFGLGPKLVVVAIVCFFPIVVNAVDGLRSTDAELVRMMRTLDASRFAIFRRVEVPGALPADLLRARIAATYAAVGAVFGEWAGSSAGLGFVMIQAQPALDTAADLRRRPHPLRARARPLRRSSRSPSGSRSLEPGGHRCVSKSSLSPRSSPRAPIPSASAGSRPRCRSCSTGRRTPITSASTTRRTHGMFAKRGPRRLDPRAVRSDHAAQARRGGQGRPRRLLRAGAVLRRGQEAAGDRRRRRRAAAAQLDHGDRPAASRSVADLKGKTIGITGVPVRLRALDTALARAGLTRADVKVVSTSATTSCRRCSRTGSTRCSASTATSRGSSCSSADSSRRSSRSTAPACPTYDELVLVASADRLRTDPAYAATVERFVARLPRSAPQPRAAHPRRRSRSCGPSPPRVRRFLARATPATLALLAGPHGVGCMRTARLAALRRLDARTRAR